MASILFIGKSSLTIFYSILLGLDAIIYWAIGVLYDVFILICQTQLFTSSTFNEFTSRIYAVVGIVMLFVLAFQMLNNIVDPERGASGEASIKKLVTNIIVSLLILVLLPTGFKYLYRVQKVVLEENIVGKIVMGQSVDTAGSDVINGMGKQMVVTIFSSFISTSQYPSDPVTACSSGQSSSPEFCDQYHVFADPTEKSTYGLVEVFNTKEIRNAIDSDEVSYRWGLSSAAGIFVVYMLLSFCIDMGIRAAKLAYFQLIAPIPVILRIIPKQDKVFDNWIKGLTNTYLDVFIRLLIIYFGIFLIDKLPVAMKNVFSSTANASTDNIVKIFTNLAIIFGILAFMKEAPKLITEMLGLDSSSMNLGIKNKLANVPFAGKAILGASNKIHGAVTGAFGRGHSALLNGENIGAAMLRGAVQGGAAGGAQFRNQLDEQYRESTGDLSGKGSIIMRGGSIGTKLKARTGKIQETAYATTMNNRNAAVSAMESNYGIDEMRDKYVNSEKAKIEQYKNQRPKIVSDLMSEEQRTHYNELWHNNKDGSKTAEINDYIDSIYEEKVTEASKNATELFNSALSDMTYEGSDINEQNKVRSAAEEVMINIVGSDRKTINHLKTYSKKSNRVNKLNKKRSESKAQKKARSDFEAIIKNITQNSSAPKSESSSNDKK